MSVLLWSGAVYAFGIGRRAVHSCMHWGVNVGELVACAGSATGLSGFVYVSHTHMPGVIVGVSVCLAWHPWLRVLSGLRGRAAAHVRQDASGGGGVIAGVGFGRLSKQRSVYGCSQGGR